MIDECRQSSYWNSLTKLSGNIDFAGSVVEIVDKNYESLTVDGVLLQLNNQVESKVVLTSPSLSCVEVNEPRGSRMPDDEDSKRKWFGLY